MEFAQSYPVMPALNAHPTNEDGGNNNQSIDSPPGEAPPGAENLEGNKLESSPTMQPNLDAEQQQLLEQQTLTTQSHPSFETNVSYQQPTVPTMSGPPPPAQPLVQSTSSPLAPPPPPSAVPMIPTDPNYQIPQPPTSAGNNQPIYFSDGQLYPDQLNSQRNASSNLDGNTGALDIALPSELIDVYNHLGIVGRLLTSGSIATIRLIHAVRNFGENLTGILGITSPKFEYEINMHNQIVQEEEQRTQKVQQMYSTWQQPSLDAGAGLVGQPGPSGLATQMVPPPPPMTQMIPPQPSMNQMVPPPPPATQMIPPPPPMTQMIPPQPPMTQMVPPPPPMSETSAPTMQPMSGPPSQFSPQQ